MKKLTTLLSFSLLAIYSVFSQTIITPTIINSSNVTNVPILTDGTGITGSSVIGNGGTLTLDVKNIQPIKKFITHGDFSFRQDCNSHTFSFYTSYSNVGPWTQIPSDKVSCNKSDCSYT